MEDIVLGIGHNRTGVQHVVIEGNISCIKGKFRGENTFPGRAHRKIPGLLPAVNSLHIRGLDLPVKEQSSIQIECHQFFHGCPSVWGLKIVGCAPGTKVYRSAHPAGLSVVTQVYWGSAKNPR